MSLFGRREWTPEHEGAALVRRMPGGLPAPDRITIWPLERGRVGVDVAYTGVTGFDLAEGVEASLKAAGIPHSFRSEQGETWTIRLTVPPAAAGEVVARFLSSAH